MGGIRWLMGKDKVWLSLGWDGMKVGNGLNGAAWFGERAWILGTVGVRLL